MLTGRLRWDKPALMLVTGRELIPGLGSSAGGDALIQVVEAAVSGGVSLVQVREKDLGTAELCSLARELRQVLPPTALVLVNVKLPRDKAILHIAAVDGVHLAEDIWRGGDPFEMWRQELVVGCSVHSIDGALEAERRGADYLAAGSLFETPSHPGARPRGVGFLRQLCSAVDVPVLAIGGVLPENVEICLNAGAAGVAVRSPILSVCDPAVAAGRYRQVLDNFRSCCSRVGVCSHLSDTENARQRSRSQSDNAREEKKLLLTTENIEEE